MNIIQKIYTFDSLLQYIAENIVLKGFSGHQKNGEYKFYDAKTSEHFTIELEEITSK